MRGKWKVQRGKVSRVFLPKLEPAVWVALLALKAESEATEAAAAAPPSSTATQSTAPISAHYVDSRSNTPALLSSMQMQAGQQRDAAEALRELCGILPITSKTSPSSASSMTTKKSLRPGIDDQRFLKRLAAATLSCLRNLKPRDGDNRAVVQARLQELGEWAVPGSTMQLFGSTACELHAHGADLDLTLLLPLGAAPSYAKQQEIVRHLAQAFEPLQASGEFTLVEAIDRARVPILKLQHAATGLQCDLSIGNDLAVRKTRLLHAYVLRDSRGGGTSRVQSLCLLIKHWAKRRDLTFRVKRASGGISFHGAFNSYAWVRRSCSQPTV